MSWSSNIQNDLQNNAIFCILRPRRLISSWTLHSGSIYYADFDYGYVRSVFQEDIGDSLTPVETIGDITSGTFFYDVDAQRVYLQTTTSADPNTLYMAMEYELYVGTRGLNWGRIPDAAVGTTYLHVATYYDPVIIKPPNVKYSASDVTIGYLPFESTSISIANADGAYNRHLYDSSFIDSEIEIWHLAGNPNINNFVKLATAIMGNFTWDNGSLEISITDKIKTLDYKWGYAGADYRYHVADFSGLDPDSENLPIRKVYGRVDGFVPVNVGFNATPATNNNRNWAVSQGDTNKATIVRNVVHPSANNTSTQTELDSADGLYPGDYVRFDNNAMADATVKILTVNYTTKIITHGSIGARTTAAGDTVTRPFIPVVYIIVGRERPNIQTLIYIRDFTVGTTPSGGGVGGFDLVNNFEANFPGIFEDDIFKPGKDQIFCSVYGETDLPSPSITGLTVNQEWGNLANPIGILYKLIRELRGIRSGEIVLGDFITLVAANNEKIGFAIPPSKEDKTYPTYKDLILKILQSFHLRMFFDGSGLRLKQLKPMIASVNSADSYDVIANNYSVDYDDLYNIVNLSYRKQEIYHPITGLAEGDFILRKENVYTETLHRVFGKEIDIATYIYETADANSIADHYSFYFGERRAKFDLDLPAKILSATVDDAITINLERLPGYDFARGTEQSRDYNIVEINKGTATVSVVLDDQKGVEDNAGSW